MDKQPDQKPEWIKMKQSDVEKLIVELGNKGNSPTQIGVILRDQHGIPKAKLLGKKISKVLKENNVKTSTEKDQMQKRISALEVHISQKAHDKNAKRSLIKRLWAIKKLS
jgi:ribosomal protein S15P/S13E